MGEESNKIEEHKPVVYVHFGTTRFDSNHFIPVKNSRYHIKPAGHTGLWASRENDAYGWDVWCRRNDYKVEKLEKSFRFTLPDANILAISEPDDLIPLPKLHPWEYTELTPDDIPSFDLVNGEYVPSWCYLDFEKLAETYDAIELRNSQLFSYILYGWDCDCLLVLNGDKITEV